MARSTRSTFIVNSEPGTSSIFMPPPGCFFHSTRAKLASFTQPPSPLNLCVVMDQSRSQPSSWELEVRRMFGQAGQLGFEGSFHTGGLGRISNW